MAVEASQTTQFFEGEDDSLDESLADSQEIEIPNLQILHRLRHDLGERQLDEPSLRLAEAFLQVLLFRDTVFTRRPPEQAVPLLLDMLHYARAGERDVPRLRVFQPSLEEHGYTCEGMVIESWHPDGPFLVDTTQLLLQRRTIGTLELVHPILHCTFDAEGRLNGLFPRPGEGTLPISYTHFEVEGMLPEQAGEIAEALRTRLSEVRQVTTDFPEMLARVDSKLAHLARSDPKTAKDRFKVAEAADFLRWLKADNFVFLAYRNYDIETDSDGEIQRISLGAKSPLGLSRDPTRTKYDVPKSGDGILDVLRRRLAGRSRVIVDKTNAESPIHRPGKLDHIVMKNFDEEGKLFGCGVFLGLFTKKALDQPGSEIPILRWKLKKVLRQACVSSGSHFGKELSRGFSGLPTEFLFMARTNTVYKAIRTIVSAQSRGQVGLFAGVDEIGRALYVTLALPKQRHSENLRAKVEEFLVSHIRADYSDNRVLYRENTVLLHFYVTSARETITTQHVEELEDFLLHLTKSWEERVIDAMDSGDSKRIKTTARVYSKAFPESYRLATNAERTALDISNLEKVRESAELRISLFRTPAMVEDGKAHLIFYQREAIALTDIIPVLDNLGLRVLSKIPTDVSFDDGSDLHIMSFTILDPFVGLEVEEELPLIELLQGAIRAVLSGHMESDSLNKLLLRGLGWKEVDLLRAYLNYWQQLHHPYTKAFTRDVLRTHYRASRILVQLFRARFDPWAFEEHDVRPGPQRLNECSRLETQLVNYLSRVESLNEDMVLRTFANLIQTTLRTNFFRQGRDEHSISLKFDAANVEAMREPRPLFEIYVHAYHVEGVHIRGGKVARGGLRWSDRRDDYRDEVFGLMRTQMVKNAIIVPVGAKGGFVVREKDPSREDFHEAYITFICGLLDLTDNLVDGKNVPPANTVCFDEPDPYLVVAADKGTARMSDVANAVAARYGFWLGDAFASGGSKGYDHKKEAITARGAWACALAHLEESGIDESRDPITVVGVGDMSGDVFGNGLLMSPRFRLLAAFDHRNIFIDPDPDPLVSFEERERLFKLQRSSWEDYDEEMISHGGGVYKRTAKSIELTPRVRALVGSVEKELNGESLIRLILQMPVDLLWNGGIGTYVKASSEDDRDVSDKANDAVRVDARDLRAKIFAEGGNLGVSPRARIEFSRAGGRINGDFVDNSAGVDMSDREVNLKILLQPLIKAGKLSLEQRDALLEEVRNEVGELVVRQNRLHAQLLSRLEHTAQKYFDEHLALIAFLQENTGLNPQAIGLPTKRNEDGEPRQLTRPELAVLMAHVKNYAYSKLVESKLVDEVLAEPFLIHYFPQKIREGNLDAIKNHQLRRQIVANRVANFIVDRAGVLIFLRLLDEMQADVETAARAYLVASHILGASRLRYLVEKDGDRLPLGARLGSLLNIEKAIHELVRWILTWKADLPDSQAYAEQQRLLVDQIREVLPDVVSGSARSAYLARLHDLEALGFVAEEAATLADLPLLDRTLDIAKISAEKQASLAQITQLYYAIASKSSINWAAKQCGLLTPKDEWERIAFSNLCLDLLERLRDLTHRYADLALGNGAAGKEAVDEAVTSFLEQNTGRLPKIRTLRDSFTENKTAEFPPFYVLGKVILGLV